MRQIFYFLIGILISVIMTVPFVNADNCDSTYPPNVIDINSYLQCYDNLYSSPYEMHFQGTFTGYTDSWASDRAEDAVNAAAYVYGTPSIDVQCSNQFQDAQGNWWNVYTKRRYHEGTTHLWYAVYTNSQTVACPISPDSDGDGIPDDRDMYPNDPESFNVKLISFQTIDGTYNGQHVRECYQTDKGDIYCIGADYDESKPEVLVFTSPWTPYEDANTDQVGDGLISDDNEGGTPQQRDHTTDQPTGDAAADTDSALKPGQSPTGSETDNQALQGIMQNTGSIADNTKRQGEYMRDLNAAIQSMDRNITNQTAIHEREELESQQQETEADNAKNAFDGTNVSDHYNSGNFSGQLVEGSDYQPAGELSDQSWFTSFFNDNPLSSAFDSSGFSLSDSSCTMTLSIDGLGTHTLSLCEFDEEFQAAGNLLLSLTSLMALIIIAWR